MIEHVPAALGGERVDRVVAMITGLTRAEVADLIDAGAVQLRGKVVTKPSVKVVEGDEVVVRFTDAASRAAELRLRNSPDGRWLGRILWPQGGANVIMTRDVSVETAAFAVPAYTPTPPPPPPKAKPAPSRSKAKATKSRRPAARSRASARRR